MILSCYVDDRTAAILERVAAETGRSVESLAEAAIENAALEATRGDPIPPRPVGTSYEPL